MGFRQDFTEKYGFSYEAFRTWIKNHHETTIKYARDNGLIDFYMQLYSESKLNSNFEKRNGFTHRSFASYLYNRYELKLSEICENSYDKYLAEYKYYRIVKSFSKQDLIELLTKYVAGTINGSEIEITENENELITTIEESIND